MDVIVSHTNADFDALASMVAASLLYPGAVMSLPGGADRNVREFLSLHGEIFQLIPPQDVPLDRVTRLIIVETQHVHRLGRFAALSIRPGVHIILYDHHTPSHPTIQAHESVVRSYGANTTLMVTQLQEHGITIDPLQATLFALGIYEDTGSLSFSATTPEDVDIVAWLLRQGANLDLVSAFMNRTLTEAQRQILNQLLASAELHRIRGLDLLICTANASENVDDLAVLAHKMREVEHSDALFLLIRMDDTVLMVARSSVEGVNVAAITSHFGGGGHDRAASATIHHQSVEEVQAALLPVLEAKVQPSVTAAMLMSFPVRTITPQTTIDEAGKLMLRFGHNGLTIFEHGQVVGIISRHDVDRAQRHGLGHAPVLGYMNRRVVTVTPQTPLPEIERLMIERDIGRLPVMDNTALVGIVTRTDVLRALHGERYTVPHTLYRGAGATHNLWALFIERIPLESRELLAKIITVADHMQQTIFLVGGAVRDLLLGNTQLDFDILVEGEGIPLATAIGAHLGAHVVAHPKFHTAKVELPDHRRLDFATARTEYYPYPAALPTTEHSSVREDLYRRDFTMNALAMQINGEEPGRLLDPFGGNRDLADAIIRVLHTLSFVEDPTRILRAVRFEARFAFRMEERTEALARHAIQMELLDRVSGERIRAEFLQLFARPYPESALRRMDDLGILTALESSWHLTGPAPEYGRIEEALLWAETEQTVASHLLERPHQRLLLIFTRLDPAAAERLARRLRLRQREISYARRAAQLSPLIFALEQEALPPSAIDTLLHDLPIPICLLLLSLTDNHAVWERVKTYLTTWRLFAPLVTGEDLKRLGIPHGPFYSRLIHDLRAAHLDGHIATAAEALSLAKTLATEYQIRS